MTLTYKELEHEVTVLCETHLTSLDFDEIGENQEKNEIDDFKAEVQSIIESIIITTIIKNPQPGKQYHIPKNTLLNNQTLFSIYASLNHTLEQNKLLKLLSSICMESEYDIIDSFVEQYDMYGNDEIVEIIKITQLKSKIHPNLTTSTLINFILNGNDFYDAIKLTLREKGIDLDDKETQERAAPCHEVQDFTNAFNELILSKLGINHHLIPTGKKSVH